MHFSANSLPTPNLHRLLTSSVIPRPIAWVSTRSSNGVDNLAPFSLFTIASVNPPVLAVVHLNPANRTAKDTLANLHATRECVVNIVTPHALESMRTTATVYPPDVSEFDAAHVERCASHWVAVPGVQASPIRCECRLRDVVVISDQPMGGSVMLLDILGISVDDALLQDGALLPAQVDAMGKLGGDLYCTTREKHTTTPSTSSSAVNAK